MMPVPEGELTPNNRHQGYAHETLFYERLQAPFIF